MNLIIFCVLGALAALLIAQIRYVLIFHKKYKKKSNDFNAKKYPDNILEHSEKTIQAVELGIIKKQLIENDAPLYNSGQALQEYVTFVDNATVYKKLSNLKGSRYNG